MRITSDFVSEAFKYHPPHTPQRVADHEMVNEASEKFAIVLLSMVEDEDYRKALFMEIQKVRMLANQAIALRDFI